jgi:hypothetical protein
MKLIQRDFEWTEDLLETLQGSEPVDQRNWRHGHSEAYVFEHDGALWKVWINVHHSEGWETHDKFRATQVRPVQKTITVYEAVPLASNASTNDTKGTDQ